MQLIQQSRFGPERFDPFGPRPRQEQVEAPTLRLATDGFVASREVCSCTAEGPLPETPLHLSIAELPPAPPRPEVEVRTEYRPTVLASHLVGSLLDVLA
ncbi:MAG: hypothetical protein AAFX76_02470 [Planctomycetota bacterium]